MRSYDVKDDEEKFQVLTSFNKMFSDELSAESLNTVDKLAFSLGKWTV